MAENVTVEMHSQVPVRMSSAGRLFAELHDQVAAWSSDHEARAAVRISPEDGGILEVVAEQSRVSLPFEWSTTFGHAVHDLRSGLDHLVQQLCRLEGQEPANPRSVQFPVATKGDQWRRAKRELQSMPASLLARIEELQPCRSSGELGAGLLLLNQLAVHDKHYELTPLVLIPTEFSLDSIEPWPVGLVDEVDWDSVNMRVHISPSAGDDVRGLKGLLPLGWMPVLVLDGRMAPLLDVMPWLHAVTQGVIDTVTGGSSSMTRPPAPVWANLPSEGLSASPDA